MADIKQHSALIRSLVSTHQSSIHSASKQAQANQNVSECSNLMQAPDKSSNDKNSKVNYQHK